VHPSLALLERTDGRSEVYDGELRERPIFTFGYRIAVMGLYEQLMFQIDREAFDLRQGAGHLSIPGGNSYLPALFVIPVALQDVFRGHRNWFEAYADPVSFVAEIWSPASAPYDVDLEIRGYLARGDDEIWRLDPFAHELRMWRRQPDGTYVETLLRGGTLSLHALPGVAINLDELFV
jgi:Uma2 family endonuclease